MFGLDSTESREDQIELNENGVANLDYSETAIVYIAIGLAVFPFLLSYILISNVLIFNSLH